VRFIKKYVAKYGRVPPENEIYKRIAENHLSEDKNYYVKLARAKL
jgi:hypothetical protein